MMMKFRSHEYVLSEIYCSYPDFSYPALVETTNFIYGMFYMSDGNQVGLFEMRAKEPSI